MVSFPTAVRNGFKKAFDFSGRATRAEFWWWQLFYVLALTIFSVLVVLLGEDAIIYCISIFGIATIIPTLSLNVRRLHDCGLSAWGLLLGLIPYIGGLTLFVILGFFGSVTENQYGPIPYKQQDSTAE